jgi:hypothetical protein
MGQPTRALLAALDTACNSVEDPARAAAELFQTHPDYAIIISFPGLADSTGVRGFAGIGDDRARFADARAYQEQPTRGRRLDGGVLGRLQLWPCPPALPPLARKRRPPRRLARHLFNKLHRCLQHHQTFDEAKAFPMPLCNAA